MEEIKVCIFSGSTEGLNTSMSLKLDGGETVVVWISDEFVDNATPKIVKDAYLAKHPPAESEDMKQFRILAAKLNIQIPTPGQSIPEPPRSLIIPTTTAVVPQRTIKAPPVITESSPILDPSNKLVTGRAADGRDISSRVKIIMGDSGAAQAGGLAGQYSVTSQSKSTVDLKEGEVAEIGQVTGRCGLTLSIPVRRTGKTGVTNVRVVDSGGDNSLQRRFKDMATASKSEQGVVYGRDGYETRTVKCPLCAMRANPVCKKCNGLGMIDIVKPFG